MTVLFATHPAFARHDTGSGHPERPQRLQAVLDGAEAAGLGEALARAGAAEALPVLERALALGPRTGDPELLARIRVALLGPSGTEGLSVKGTRLLQRLDPHWHSVRGRQAEGRGVRMDSHLHLPVEDRSVTVQDFRSRLPGRTFGGPAPGVDEWMARRAEGRDRLNRAFLSVLKQIGRSNRPT